MLICNQTIPDYATVNITRKRRIIMTDIVPELMEKIQQKFEGEVKENKKVKEFKVKLNEERATGDDVSMYAVELGNIASNVLISNLTEDVLPNGRMYYNIANRTIKPLLKQIFGLVMEAARTQLEIENKSEKIGIKAIDAEFKEDKINDLMFKLSEIFEEAADE